MLTIGRRQKKPQISMYPRKFRHLALNKGTEKQAAKVARDNSVGFLVFLFQTSCPKNVLNFSNINKIKFDRL